VGIVERLVSFAADLPGYALIGGVPLPFAFVSEGGVRQAWPLGWAVVVGVASVLAIAVPRQLRERGRVSRALGLFAFGFVVVFLALAPVAWADLGLRRRYFYMPSVGSVIMMAVALEWLAANRLRASRALLAVLTIAGAVGLWQRNEMYRDAGEVTRSLVAIAEEVAEERGERKPFGRRGGFVFLGLPRYLGGDRLSGAYVLHWTDVVSALRYSGIQPWVVSTGLKFDYADEYSLLDASESGDDLVLQLSFASDRAYRAMVERGRDRTSTDWRPHREGVYGARLEGEDAGARRMQYRVTFGSMAQRDSEKVVVVFDDGEFRRWPPPRDAR
jgi:hypothetical protein